MSSETLPEPRTKQARLLIADDHDLARNEMQSMLARQPDLEVVGEAKNGQQALELCRQLRPDLVLMDVRMPGMDGLQVTRKVKKEQPATTVLIITACENPDYLLEALRAGATGYILKDTPKRQLIDAIRRGLNGESPLNQELAAQLIRGLANKGAPEAAQRSSEPKRRSAPPNLPIKVLTRREVEVLGLLVQGQSNVEIARTLTISKATAKVHVERIIKKLGACDRTQAAVRAVELGLLDREHS